MSDSDGEDAMAYFLPNGIANGIANGIYGSAPSALDLAAPLYGGEPLGSATATSGGATTSSSSRGTFLLSDLGGEILTPRGGDAGSTGHAIGGGRHPFAFSGAFASLSAAESEADARARAAAGSHGTASAGTVGSVGGGRYDRGGTPTGGGGGGAGFRSDADIFAPASAANASSSAASGVYGRATLNANAPAFMASSAAADAAAAPFGSASPSSAWPTMNVKPRRAPPGLSKSAEPPSASAISAADGGASSLSLPPGLPHPTPSSSSAAHSSAFGASTASLFSGEGVRQFASKLRPNFPSLSDTFRDRAFPSTLSELNAKSLSVEEIQSNLKATALAAAHDVVADTPVDAKAPRKAARSPRRREVEFKSPSTGDEKPPGARAPVDPRARTPTRRHDATATPSAAHGAASPVATGSRRGRNARDSTAVEGAGRNARAAPSEPSTRSGRRGRGGGGGQGASGESRAGNRTAPAEAATGPIALAAASRKKPPSSVSSVGSDDQLVMVAAVAVPTEESRELPVKVKESPRNVKSAAGRNAHNAKKAATPVQPQEKRGGAKRQVYREKPSSPEAPKSDNVKPAKADVPVLVGGSDSDTSAVDGPTEDNVDVVSKASTSETQVQPSVDDVTPVAPSAGDEAEASLPTASLAPASPAPNAELKKAASSEANVSLEDLPEPVVDEPTPSSSVAIDEKSPVPESPRASPSAAPPSTPSRLESDSGSEIPELSSRTVRASDRKVSAKDHKKDKHRKEKSDKKKAVAPAKSNKKEKRDSSSSGKGDLADDEPFGATPTKKAPVAPMVKLAGLLRDGRVLAKRSIAAVWSACWFLCTEFADRINLKGFLGWSFSYLESFLAVVFSVVLLLSLHGASFFIRLHRVAFRAVLTHRHVGFCFAFLYAFPFLVQYVFPWAPPWAPVCLWYAFLVQLFCTSGPAAMVATFRIVLPLMFLVEGISHHSFLLDLNGAELLLASFILSAMKTSNLCSPIFLMSLAVQCLSAVFLGSELVVQWFQMTLALYSLHAMAASDEDWAGLGDEEEDLSCRPLSMHHSIADYNYHPAPSAPSVQKTKRLDRRALAYVRGRKLR